MNRRQLFPLLLLAAGFSGTPLPKAEALSETKVSIIGSFKESNEVIPWSSKRLTWEDFLCEPKKGTDAVASTSTSLGIAYQMVNGRLVYDVTCHFSKKKSWGLMRTDYILAHEQGHFDITEIFARRLHQALSEYQLNKKTFKQDIGAIYQSIVKQKEELQAQYDEQTDHSRKRRQQYNWLETIQSLLDETEAFSNYP